MKQSLICDDDRIPPIERLTGAWEFRCPPGGPHKAKSTPGHLLHLVRSGSYRLQTNSREYGIQPLDVIYYHETEEVDWLGNTAPVVFYSVGFLAPRLPPLPPERRVFASTQEIRAGFDELFAAYRLVPGMIRAVGIHVALLRLIQAIDWGPSGGAGELRAAPPLWGMLERVIRERRMFRPTLEDLARLAHASRATVVRSCRASTRMSPMQRLRQIRMDEARGLLRYSALNMTQIADYLGYARVHEFSREFARCVGQTPTGFRAKR